MVSALQKDVQMTLAPLPLPSPLHDETRGEAFTPENDCFKSDDKRLFGKMEIAPTLVIAGF